MRSYVVEGFGYSPDRIAATWIVAVLTEDDGARADELARCLTDRLARLPRTRAGMVEAMRHDRLDPRQERAWILYPSMVGAYYIVHAATDDPTAECAGCGVGLVVEGCALHCGDPLAPARIEINARKMRDVTAMFRSGELVGLLLFRQTIVPGVLVVPSREQQCTCEVRATPYLGVAQQSRSLELDARCPLHGACRNDHQWTYNLTDRAEYCSRCGTQRELRCGCILESGVYCAAHVSGGEE